MNFNNVFEAVLMVFDELKNDDKSSEIIELIDQGESDTEIKEGLTKGIERLRELGKDEMANDVESKIKKL